MRGPRSLFLAVAITFALLYSFFNFNGQSYSPKSTSSPSPPHPSSRVQEQADILHLKTQVNFWEKFHHALTTNNPACDTPTKTAGISNNGFVADKEIDRPDLLEFKDGENDIEKLRKAHENFLRQIEDEQIKPPFREGTRGVVITTGAKTLPVLVISVRMLRLTGSELPVEVFLGSDADYNAYICETVLPQLNATCKVLDDVVGFSSSNQPDLKSYQFKSFAMLFSSFDEFLLLDADAFPIQDPSLVFTSEPFTSNGMITWPDFWGPSQSKHYYRISNQPIPPMTLRASSETGEVFLTKSTHWRSLLLANYYNYYGPSHYYPLLSQGALGEGDKETFVAATTALNESVYTVSEKVRAIGTVHDGNFAGSAMVQFDPREDYALTSKGIWRVKDPEAAPLIKPFFLHANYPKFDPATVFSFDNQVPPGKDSNGKYRRAWTDGKDTMAAFPYDVEKSFWKEIMWVACELEDKFVTWKGKHGICREVKTYFETVHANQASLSIRANGDAGR